MHMAMRKYRLLKGTHADATHWVERNLMPTLRKAPGFRAYYAVVFDDGIFGSINVFDSEAAAEDANRHVRERVGDSASDMLQHVDTKVWTMLHEEHA